MRALEGRGHHPFVLGQAEQSEVGRKAATLAALRAAGFPVPQATVVPPDVDAQEAAARLVESFGHRPLAIRSSAPHEDGAEESAAGRYATALDVVGPDSVARAITMVRTSLPGQPIPVLVMPMLAIDVSGAAFTRDPVTGDEQVMVEAVRGSASGFLAGVHFPERWSVEDGVPTRLSGGPEVLTAKMAEEVADLALRVEQVAGAPQDIEWAVAEGRLWLLQARPITALPRPPAIDVPDDGTWTRLDENFATPLRPLEFDLWAPRAERATQAAAAEAGLPVDRIAFRLIGGWVYSRLMPLGSDNGTEARLPGFVVRALFRLVPELRRRMKAALAAWESDLAESIAEAWDIDAGPRLDAAARRLWRVDRTGLTETELAADLRAGLALLEEAWRWHARLTTLGTVLGLGRLGSMLESRLGWEPHRILTLVHDGWGRSARTGRAVERLAASIERDGAALAALSAGAVDLPDALATHLEPFLAAEGHVVMGNDLTHPTWAEDPRPVVALVRAMLERGRRRDDDSHRRAREAERDARAALRGSDLAEFERALEQARRLQPYADITEWTALAATGAVRLSVAEIGRRFTAAGALGEAWDILYLTEQELLGALNGAPLPADLQQRKAEYRWALSHRGPDRYGPETQIDFHLAALPRRLRGPMAGMQWAATLTRRSTSEPAQPSPTHRGTPASPGVASGPARLVRDPTDFPRLRPGDVVVCPYTLAAWAAIFPLVAGVVAESGGPLSHPAVLAREFGIPAVVGLEGATTLFPEGSLIEVNGSSGWVRRLD